MKCEVTAVHCQMCGEPLRAHCTCALLRDLQHKGTSVPCVRVNPPFLADGGCRDTSNGDNRLHTANPNPSSMGAYALTAQVEVKLSVLHILLVPALFPPSRRLEKTSHYNLIDGRYCTDTSINLSLNPCMIVPSYSICTEPHDHRVASSPSRGFPHVLSPMR